MATVQLIVDAAFKGRAEIQEANKELKRLKEGSEGIGTTAISLPPNLDQVLNIAEQLNSSGAGGGLADQFGRIQQELSTINPEVFERLRLGAEAAREKAGALEVQLAKLVATGGDSEDITDLEDEIAELQTLASGLDNLNASIDETGLALQQLSPDQLMVMVRALPLLEGGGRVMGQFAQATRSAGLAALEAGNTIGALNASAKVEAIDAFNQSLIKAEVNLGATDQQVNTLANDINGLNSVMDEFASKSAAGGGQLVNLDKQIDDLERMKQEQEEAASAAARLGKSGKEVAAFIREFDRLNEQIKVLERLQRGLSATGKSIQALSKHQISKQLGGVQGIDNIVAKLEEMRIKTVAAGKSALQAGDQVRFQAATEGVKNIDDMTKAQIRSALAMGVTAKESVLLNKKLQEINNGYRATVQSSGLFLKQLNLIGFSIFITISSIKTIVGLFRDLKDAIKDAASAASLFKSFNILIAQGGTNAAGFSKEIKAVSGGLLELANVQQSSLRLLKAGIPAYQSTTLMLARLASNAARVSGELGNVNEIFDKLVRGIVRGSPRLIDDTDVVLRLGKAYEAYAESVGKSTDELSEREQQLAVISALEEEAVRIQQLSDAIGDLPVEPIVRAENALKDLANTLKITLGNLFTQGVGGLMVPQEVIELSEALKRVQTEAAISEINLGRLQSIVRAFESGAIGGDKASEGIKKYVDTLDAGQQAQIKFMAAINIGGQILRHFGGIVGITAQIVAEFFLAASQLTEVDWSAWLDEGILKFRQIGAAISLDFDEMKRLQDEIDNLDFQPQGLEELFGFGDAIEALKNRYPDLEEEVLSLIDLFQNAGVTSTEAYMEQLEALGIPIRSLTEEVPKLTDATRAGLNAMIKSLDDLSGPLARFHRDIAKSERNHNERMFEINQDLSERLVEIFEDRGERLKDIHDGFNEEMEEITEDLADKLGDIEEDAADDREKENKKHKKKQRDIEEDHQKKLKDIQRKFELARLKALIDRDARAIFEAEMRRDEDIRKAKEAIQEKRKDEEDDHKDKLKDIKDKEEEAAAAAREAAEKKRADAREDRAKELEELSEWYDEQTEKAREGAQKQRDAALKSLARRKRDLQESLDEQEILAAAAAHKRSVQQLLELGEQEGQTVDFTNKVMILHRKLNTWFANNPLVYSPIVFGPAGPGGFPYPTGPGGVLPPTFGGAPVQGPGIPGNPGGGGGSFPACIDTMGFTPNTGSLCSPEQFPVNTKQTATNCTFWKCVNLNGNFRWAKWGSPVGAYSAPSSETDPATRGTAGIQGTSLGGLVESGGTGTQVPVTINVTNDETLHAILSGISYQAFIDITEGSERA